MYIACIPMFAKRIFDWIVLLAALPLALPLLLLVALVVRIGLGTPVLFRQQRPGLHGRLFWLVKFRTMRNCITGENMLATDGVRLGRLGALLRKCSLDELPSLWNIAKGEMSWVGPRPLLPEYLPLYNAQQQKRHNVLPGLTGWAQIHGRNALDWPARFELDVWYVENRSLWLDMQILLKTVATVVGARQVSAPGQATVEPFRGNP